MAMEIEKFKIEGPMLIKPNVFSDQRGYFFEMYKASDFRELGIIEDFKQDNFSFSKQGVLRGLHYQIAPKAQAKLVRVIAGKIWDVAIDIRKSSPTFGQWVAAELSEENNFSFYIPKGFAHGFVVLSEEAKVVYKTTEEYSPEHERGIIFNDQVLGIAWPAKSPQLNERDSSYPSLADAEVFS